MRRATLRQSIAERVDDLIEANARRRGLRNAALSHQSSWRDLVMFVSTLLFATVWWYVDHERMIWWPLFVVLLAASVLFAYFAWRSLFAGFRR